MKNSVLQIRRFKTLLVKIGILISIFFFSGCALTKSTSKEQKETISKTLKTEVDKNTTKDIKTDKVTEVENIPAITDKFSIDLTQGDFDKAVETALQKSGYSVSKRGNKLDIEIKVPGTKNVKESVDTITDTQVDTTITKSEQIDKQLDMYEKKIIERIPWWLKWAAIVFLVIHFLPKILNIVGIFIPSVGIIANRLNNKK